MRLGLRAAAALFGLLGTVQAKAQDSNTELLGNMAGLRTMLGESGISLGIQDSENLLANLTGGIKTGATMQGVTTATLQMDTGKALGLEGGTINVSALQIHGRPLSPYYLGTLQAANGDEAENDTRLWELWYDQQFADNKFDVKIGQISLDTEFMDSVNSALFVNTMAGWPLVPSADLYGGGPAYPLSSLGVRLQAEPSQNTAILAGVFDDNPGGGAFNADAQELDSNGTKFNLNTGALFITELHYTAKLQGLPGEYKIGFWYDTGFFPDQRFGTDGLPLADPLSNGQPVMHHGNYSLYAIIDQAIWQSKGAENLNVYGRIAGAPSEQNLITFAFNGGFVLNAPFPGRDNDAAGLDFGIGQVSSQASGHDRDEEYFNGSFYPARGTEEIFELTYQAQATPFLTLQPVMQYVINPGAGVRDPDDQFHKLQNVFVIGARATTTF